MTLLIGCVIDEVFELESIDSVNFIVSFCVATNHANLNSFVEYVQKFEVCFNAEMFSHAIENQK